MNRLCQNMYNVKSLTILISEVQGKMHINSFHNNPLLWENNRVAISGDRAKIIWKYRNRFEAYK